MGIRESIEWRLKQFERKLYLSDRRKRLNKPGFTVICSNCTGAVMMHDLGLEFNTPFVNLAVEMNDFVKMVRNLPYYMSLEMEQVKDSSKEYPVGMLGDIRIELIHYPDFNKAKEDWDRRKKRINWDDLVIIGSQKDGATEKTLKEFDALPYPNKMILTVREYPEIRSAVYVPQFVKDGQLIILTNWKKRFLHRRFLDDFDYVTWLNNRK